MRYCAKFLTEEEHDIHLAERRYKAKTIRLYKQAEHERKNAIRAATKREKLRTDPIAYAKQLAAKNVGIKRRRAAAKVAKG
jgi:hypothetical protein